MKAIQSNRSVDKQTGTSIQWNVTHQFKKWTKDACNNLDESQSRYVEWKKPVWKGYIRFHLLDVLKNIKLETFGKMAAWGEPL